ncbi:hypothetical protein DNTS_027861, partial [Danionella cerebrum]
MLCARDVLGSVAGNFIFLGFIPHRGVTAVACCARAHQLRARVPLLRLLRSKRLLCAPPLDSLHVVTERAVGQLKAALLGVGGCNDGFATAEGNEGGGGLLQVAAFVPVALALLRERLLP